MGTKTIKSDDDAQAGVVVAKTVARMHGSKDNYVSTDENGTTINGPMSFVAGSDQIRVGGLWTFNNQMLMSLPSTIATPVATMVINPPARQLAELMKDATVMVGLITGLAAL